MAKVATKARKRGTARARKPAKPVRRPKAPTARAPGNKRKGASRPVLLSGGNPQIAKAYGDAPVQAYIAAMPGWKKKIGRRLDEIISDTVRGILDAGGLRQVRIFASGGLDEDLQEVRRAAIGFRTIGLDQLELLLGIAGTCGNDRAAQGPRAGIHDEAARRQMIAEGVEHHVAPAKARCEQRAREPPVISRLALGLVDAARRREHAPQPTPLRGGEAAERPLGALQLAERRLAHHRKARERFT